MCHIIFIVCVPDWILYYILCGNFYWMCYIANKILRKGNYEFLSDVMAMVPYHRWNITNWAHAHNECRNAWTPRNTGRSDLAQNVRWTSRYCLPRFAYNESIRKTPAHDAYIFPNSYTRNYMQNSKNTNLMAFFPLSPSLFCPDETHNVCSRGDFSNRRNPLYRKCAGQKATVVDDTKLKHWSANSVTINQSTK